MVLLSFGEKSNWEDIADNVASRKSLSASLFLLRSKQRQVWFRVNFRSMKIRFDDLRLR